MEPMTSVWKDPTKYKDYDKLWPLVSMAKKIVVGDDGYPINIEKINDQYKGFYLRKDRPENPIKWNAITVYQRLPDFQFIADKIDQRYTLLKNEFEKIETVTQAVINYIGPQSITPLHSDSKTYKGSGQDYIGGVMANGVVAPTYQIMIGLWIPPFDNDEIGLEFPGHGFKTWKTDEALAFDGAYDHQGWNRTDFTRVSLFIDVLKSSIDE